MAARRFSFTRRQFLGASALLLARRSLADGGARRSLADGGAVLPAVAPRERRLYVTNASGISVYDIDKGHAFLRKIEIPDSGDYKGIAAARSWGACM